MNNGIPGGYGKYNHVFSKKLNKDYKNDLIQNWKCDTLIGVILNKLDRFLII